jgi:hypothetical protein
LSAAKFLLTPFRPDLRQDLYVYGLKTSGAFRSCAQADEEILTDSRKRGPREVDGTTALLGLQVRAWE